MLFPKQVLRIEKIQNELRKKGIDVLILTNPQKIAYVARTYNSIWNSETCIFVWANADPTMLAPNTEKQRLIYENNFIEDLRFWNKPLYGLKPISWSEKCIEIFNEKKVEKGTIAVEEPHIPLILYSKLREKLPKANFVYGEDLINEVMRVKDDEELSLIQRASAIADAGMEAVMESAKVGVTEAQLAGVAEKAMRELGCAYFYEATQMNFDNRILCDHIPTDRILQRGDTIQMDLHPVWQSYRGDYFRVLILGKPTREYEKVTEVCTEAAREMIKSIIPGASTSEIASNFDDRIRSAGYHTEIELGHGIGTGHLPPLICTGQDWKLKEKETFTIFPHVYDLGKFSFAMELLVNVVKGGCVLFNKYPLGLIVIDR